MLENGITMYLQQPFQTGNYTWLNYHYYTNQANYIHASLITLIRV